MKKWVKTFTFAYGQGQGVLPPPNLLVDCEKKP